MKVLVTGASGFVGREIVSELTARNYQVTALRNSKNRVERKLSNLEYLGADITDYENLSALENLSDVEVLIHSAGLAHQFGETKWEEFERVNVRGVENILNLAVKIKVKHFILIGSTAVYGVPPSNRERHVAHVATEATPTNPQTLYAESKLEGERICQRICRENNIALTIFRLAPVIGEANVGNVARLIRTIDKNQFVWIGDGGNFKSLIYKRDVARACAQVIENKNRREEIFNLAAAEPVRMKDLVNEISKCLNVKIFPAVIPASFPRKIFKVNSKILRIKKIDKISETIEKWLADDIYSADKIAETYNFKAPTSIFEAISKQVNYYQANKS